MKKDLNKILKSNFSETNIRYSHSIFVLRVSPSRLLIVGGSSDLNHVLGSVFVNWEV